ncbi:uncharacterized protein LOC116121717 [Pistacia vera]|uniref:uncharacterized protein LOC116121717 n=1 Tax=Pistacia vera TaxID=55513 RepID=UPI001263C518|nr:uncharacterized protein LOC116121717 [Pistacia vera]
MSVQGSTEGAINQLTRNLACEWAKDNIRCNAVAPWYIKTSMVEQVLSKKEYLEEVYSVTPARRLGDPTEVSSLMSFSSLRISRLQLWSICPLMLGLALSSGAMLLFLSFFPYFLLPFTLTFVVFSYCNIFYCGMPGSAKPTCVSFLFPHWIMTILFDLETVRPTALRDFLLHDNS